MSEHDLKHIIEATLLAAGRPVTRQQLLDLFDERERPTQEQLEAAFDLLAQDYASRGIEVIEVASGWRVQVRPRCAEVVSRLWQERPSRYSRALLETLALVAYRQPITRSEIEEIRGVSISSTIMRTLQERNWIRVVGHREVPGRPELLGTTKEFLDYFGLKSLDQLPTLAELKDLETIGVQLELPDGEVTANAPGTGEATSAEPALQGQDSGAAEGADAAGASAPERAASQDDIGGEVSAQEVVAGAHDADAAADGAGSRDAQDVGAGSAEDDAQRADEQVVDEQSSDEQVGDEQAGDEQSADQLAADGQVADEQPVDEQVADAQVADAQLADAQAVDGEVADEHVADEQMADERGQQVEGAGNAQASTSTSAAQEVESSTESSGEAGPDDGRLLDDELLAQGDGVDDAVREAGPEDGQDSEDEEDDGEGGEDDVDVSPTLVAAEDADERRLVREPPSERD